MATWPLALLALFGALALPRPAAAAEPGPPPPWAATLKAGAFVLRSPGVAGHPTGPDLEVSLGRTIYELVSVEVAAGAYTASLTHTGTRLTVVPFTVSLKLMAAPELGFEAYAVAGLGANLVRLGGGSLGADTTARVAYHAGLGVRRRFGERLFAGLEGRYLFQDVSGPAGRLDGLRLSALAGLLF
jgi:opacity protein-like surface antigen